MEAPRPQSRKAADILHNGHFWIIAALTVFLTISYYADEIAITDHLSFGKGFLSADYADDLFRSLLLIPMIYTAAVFRFRGAVVISVATAVLVVPGSIAISPHSDIVLRVVIFTVVATMATVVLGQERAKRRDLDTEVADRKRLQETLRQERDFSTAVVDTSGALVAVFDAEGRIIRFNKAAEHATGYSLDEVKGRRVWDMLLIPEEREPVESLFDDILAGTFPNQFENYWVAKDGTRRRISWSNTALLDRRGAVEYVIATGIDITERKLFEDILTESEARYRTIFENASDGIYLRDLDGNIIVANTAIANLTGYAVDALKQMNISQILTPSSFCTAMERQQARLRGDSEAGTERQEFHIIRKDGTERVVEVMTSLLGGKTKLPVVQAIARDVTEERRAQENVRIYANLVMQAQEEERKRIARELHDDTVQSLARLALDIDQLIGTKRKLPDDLLEALEDLRTRTDETLKGVRRFSQDLRPPMLEDLGLLDTLQWMADDVTRQSNFSVSVHVLGTPRRLSPQKELALFRIAQEALNNIKKHANATETTVKIEFGQQEVKLSITDNGKGFEVPRGVGHFARLGKLGMMGMQERATLAGGTLDVNSDPATGTTISVLIKDS